MAVSTDTAKSLLAEEVFLQMLQLERRRVERSQRGFVLMLLESETLFGSGGIAVEKLAKTLEGCIRETDFRGWYEESKTVGVIFTEVEATTKNVALEAIAGRVGQQLSAIYSREQISQLTITFYTFPEDGGGTRIGDLTDTILTPEYSRRRGSNAIPLFLKRQMDLVGSVSAIVLLSPMLAALAAAIKVTSRGPVFFKQKRVGLHGEQFTLLKFRSMTEGCDASIHQDYVKGFIAGGANESNDAEDKHLYKLKSDARITPIGNWLRKTSLDELPQLFNVVLGKMSLVGPRPPIPYEVDCYGLWHKRRFLAAKPGMTGLWQVKGRSRTTFDEMVRLDLRYARSWSIWLDIKILIETPKAVLWGDGAH